MIAEPLYELIKKDSKWNWSPEAEKSFQELKRKLTEAPILKLPKFNQPFRLAIDASDTEEIEGVKHPVAYASKVLNKLERKYTTLEKEAYALLWSIKHFKRYLYGNQFEVFVDNNPLSWLKTAQFTSARVMRWSLELQNYNFAIKYKKGKSNFNADALSRMFFTIDEFDSEVNLI